MQIEMPSNANKGFHGRDQDRCIFYSENQPSEEHEKLGHEPRKKHPRTARHGEELFNEANLASKTMDDEQ